ncbi:MULTISPECIES: hypothetical protein, partial [unclassified Ruegeria]|uniref:hypothetical protein n=1 Tax=unclassified Ruegeria TaxID=2625375 RepID=UPI001C2C41BB
VTPSLQWVRTTSAAPVKGVLSNTQNFRKKKKHEIREKAKKLSNILFINSLNAHPPAKPVDEGKIITPEQSGTTLIHMVTHRLRSCQAESIRLERVIKLESGKRSSSRPDMTER